MADFSYLLIGVVAVGAALIYLRQSSAQSRIAEHQISNDGLLRNQYNKLGSCIIGGSPSACMELRNDYNAEMEFPKMQ